MNDVDVQTVAQASVADIAGVFPIFIGTITRDLYVVAKMVFQNDQGASNTKVIWKFLSFTV